MERRLLLAGLLVSKGKTLSGLAIYDKVLNDELLQNGENSSGSNQRDRAAKLYFNLSQSLVNCLRGSEKGVNVSDSSLIMTRAIEYLKEAIFCSPCMKEAYLNIIGLYVKQRTPELAIMYIEQGLALIDTERNKSDDNSHENLSEFKSEWSYGFAREIATNMNVAYRQLGWRRKAMEETWRLLPLPLTVHPSQLLHHHHTLSSAGSMSSETSACTLLTIVCVKHGEKYGAEYVLRLFRMIQRHWVFPTAQQTEHNSNNNHHNDSSIGRNSCDYHWSSFRFVCFTDNAHGLDELSDYSNCQIKMLSRCFGDWVSESSSYSNSRDSSNKVGWWSKIHAFNTETYIMESSSHILYIDLDTVIIDYSLQYLHQLYSTYSSNSLFVLDASSFANEHRPRGINSSLILFPARHFDYFYTFFLQNNKKIMSMIYKFDHYLEMMLGDHFFDPEAESKTGDQCLAYCIQDHPAVKEYIVDYRCYQERQRGIVCFPLHPKPHQLHPDSPLYIAWTQ